MLRWEHSDRVVSGLRWEQSDRVVSGLRWEHSDRVLLEWIFLDLAGDAEEIPDQVRNDEVVIALV